MLNSTLRKYTYHRKHQYGILTLSLGLKTLEAQAGDGEIESQLNRIDVFVMTEESAGFLSKQVAMTLLKYSAFSSSSVSLAKKEGKRKKTEQTRGKYFQ